MKTALLISTYNWPKALDKVLQSVQEQTVLPDEILIADDGSTRETLSLIEEWKLKSKAPIKHFWQEDDGFRKTIIMNKAIAGSDVDYIIQIDGDIILDAHFIQDHLSERQKNFFLKGSRALIGPTNTDVILNSERLDWSVIRSNLKNKINSTRFPLGANFFRKDQLKSRDVKGCNFSFWKEDFVKVNGFNNKIAGWGHEDIELAARLNNLGIKQRRVKLKAVCYHLHHELFARKDEESNFSVYEEVIRNKVIKCEDGFMESSK